jgi:imidazolonepropionase-like amidohydrolase
MLRLSYLVVCLASMTGLTASGSDQIPGAPQERPIAIENATIHTISGDVLESATLVFEDGKITQIGADIGLPDDCQIIDGNDKHVYPSMIESYADMGLVEINSISATIDSRETGDTNPNVQAVEAFNPDSELIPVTRANGVLLSMTVPEGGLIAGRSALMMLDGWTWEDMTLQSDVGMHVRWPSRNSDVEKLETWLRDAEHYAAAREESNSSQLKDLRLEAMRPVIKGKMPLIVTAFGLDEIETAVAFAQRHSLRLIIYGGYDAPLCASLLKKADVPVIVGSVYRTPRRRHRPYDDPYALPAKLQAAGIRFCISAGGRFGASGVRNLPYNAATAAAYGLTEEQALRSITLSAAEILDVADRVGSIETGKDATLFIADGNILETETQVEQAFIQGREVDLSSKHTQLYEKYRTKYQRMSE